MVYYCARCGMEHSAEELKEKLTCKHCGFRVFKKKVGSNRVIRIKAE